MKTYVKNAIILFSFIATSVLVSCDSENDDTNQEFNFSAEDTARAAQADNVIEASLNILDNGYEESVGDSTTSNRSMQNSLFPECASIIIEPNGNGGTITLDFGDACTLNNGALVSGSIVLEYGPFESGQRTIDYTYNSFTYNGNGVSGGGTILRQIANENDNPQSTVNETITVSFPNTEVTATREAQRIAEWIEGVGSGTWTDNVYSITGNWDTQLTNGFSRSGLVTEALIRRLDCRYLVSGLLEVTQNSFTGTIDWGDGTCDNRAMLEVNGQEYEIIL